MPKQDAPAPAGSRSARQTIELRNGHRVGMRVNEPVTDHEVDYPANEPLVSRTDTAGRISFANRAFISVSGFSQQELIGAPHNIVRHPDMPAAATRAASPAARPARSL